MLKSVVAAIDLEDVFASASPQHDTHALGV
jgi:hypothetical protein